MALGLGDHALEQAAGRLLLLATARKLGLRLAKPHHERVADTLKLRDAQHPRTPDRPDSPLDPRPGKRGREQLPQPSLQAGDLAPQVVADQPLWGESGGTREPRLERRRANCGRGWG